MKESSLKIVSISSKGYKKQLLLNASEVSFMANFLRSALKNEVMIINTNLGLDVYYSDAIVQNNRIKNAFLFTIAQQSKSSKDFHFKNFNDTAEIVSQSSALFLKLAAMPMLFKSYSKSLFHQIDLNFHRHRSILMELFDIWQSVLLVLQSDEAHANKLKGFLAQLHNSYINNTRNPELKLLLANALASLRVN